MENRQECPRRAAGREGQRERGQALRSPSADLGRPSAGWGRGCGRGAGWGATRRRAESQTGGPWLAKLQARPFLASSVWVSVARIGRVFVESKLRDFKCKTDISLHLKLGDLITLLIPM